VSDCLCFVLTPTDWRLRLCACSIARRRRCSHGKDTTPAPQAQGEACAYHGRDCECALRCRDLRSNMFTCVRVCVCVCVRVGCTRGCMYGCVWCVGCTCVLLAHAASRMPRDHRISLSDRCPLFRNSVRLRWPSVACVLCVQAMVGGVSVVL
jgi:hypothetical protein